MEDIANFHESNNDLFLITMAAPQTLLNNNQEIILMVHSSNNDNSRPDGPVYCQSGK